MSRLAQSHSQVVGTGRDEGSPHLALPADAVVAVWGRGSVARRIVEIAPSRGFDPSAEEVLRWSIALAMSCRPFHHDWFAIHLRAHEGKLAYLLSGLSTSLDALLPRLPSGLTVRESPAVPAFALLESATARLTLPSSLRAVPVSPDPLGDFARVLAQVHAEEFAEVTICLTPARARSHGSLPDAGASRSGNGSAILFAALAGNVSPKVSPVSRAPKAPVSAERHLRIAVSSRACSASPERSRELALAVLAPFHAWEPSGSLRVSSERGGDEPSRPGWRGSRVVSSASIAGLLLPPITSCSAPNVRRTAASAPVPPKLPLLGPGVWPLGTPGGYGAPVGVPVREVLFGVHVGSPEHGKSSEAMTQITARTLPWPDSTELPSGGAFVDPHRDAIGDLLPYYWSCPERVLRIDLGADWEGMRLPVYNPIDCRGKSAQEAERRVSAVVGGLSVAAGWDMKATRSLPIATEAVKLLVAMARGLGPQDPVPTVFQIPWILMDLKDRATILRDPRIPQSIRRWWENEGAAYKPADFGPVTQIISRIRSTVPLAAFLGGRSTFTPRQAMDDRWVLLYGGLLSGDKEKDKLAVALFLRMMLQGGYSRGDVPREIRAERCPPFYLFVDELPTCDGADLPPIFMEMRKFMLRCQIMAVTPAALRPATWAAAVTAASIITTTAINGQGANMLTALGNWKDFDVRDLAEIEKYHHLTSVTFEGRKTAPFAIEGMQPQDLFEARPGVVEASIATDPRYRDVAQVMAELEDLDERLLEAWTGGKRRGGVSVDMPAEDE